MGVRSEPRKGADVSGPVQSLRRPRNNRRLGHAHLSADLPGSLEDTYDELTAEKRRRLRGQGDDGEGYVEASQVEAAAAEAAEDAEQQKRDELLGRIYQNTEDMTQKELADAVGLSRSRLADIISESDA